jgi:hypothetical protein
MSHAKLEVRMESLLPFLQGTCTPYNMPVYPGAQCIIANSRFEPRAGWKPTLGLMSTIEFDELRIKFPV